MTTGLVTASYIGAAVLFILSLGGLSRQDTARRGNVYGVMGMAIAIVATVVGTHVGGWIVVIPAMVVGARSVRRAVWVAGAALMTIVVAKLFLVDLGNTGTLARVVSFLGVGVLLLVVGYFAPVPPRADAAPRVASQ